MAPRRFEVLRRGDNPPRSFYSGKTLEQGLNYVKVRDGVELAMTVRLPAGKTLADGPFPTFIEYSGYQVAALNDLLNSVVNSLTGSGGPPDPLAPATSTAVGSLIGPLLDFAVVSVQMRGSGCSGGAFDLFDLPTTYDGYDAVETVAAQPWVKGGTVGMAGISFRGSASCSWRHPASPPLRCCADVGHRRPLHRHRVSGRDLQLGVRADLDRGADGGCPARAGGRPALGPELVRRA